MANRALIIANGTFADPTLTPLSSPVADGKRLKALLERSDVGDYDVTLCEDRGSVDVRHAIQQFFDDAQPGDLHLLILSTHGLKDKWSRLYFATADTLTQRLAASSVQPSFILERMDDSCASRKIMIVDACYSGAVMEGMVYKRGDEPSISPSDFGQSSGGGTTIITASSKVQFAGEKEIDGSIQSLFTRCMIEGIETGAADAGPNGFISLSELYEYVSRRLKAEAPGQTPQCLDMSHGGPIIIARNPIYREVALPDELAQRIRSRDRAHRMTAVEDLEEMAGEGGRMAELAVAALNALVEDDSLSVRALARETLARIGKAAASIIAPVAEQPPEPAPQKPMASAPSPPEPILPKPIHMETPPIESGPPHPGSSGPFAMEWMAAAFMALIVIVILFFYYRDQSAETVPPADGSGAAIEAGIEAAAASVPDRDWLWGDWFVNAASLGCTNPISVRKISAQAMEVTMDGTTQSYDYTVSADGSRVETNAFTYLHDGARIAVSGQGIEFEMSKCTQ